MSGHKGIATVRFNAWTARGENALEGLIKSVLCELDPNLVRRWARRLAQQQRLTGLTWMVLALAGRFLGVARRVDELWKRLGTDARSRNELRDLIRGMLTDWVMRDGKRDPDRALTTCANASPPWTTPA